MVSLMALSWVLMASHCKIEALPGFEFFRCAADVQSANGGGDPCQETGCCSVESAHYHAPRQQETTPVVLVAMLSADNHVVVEQSSPKAAGPGIPTADPPDLSSSWQFLSRAALSPRAPSSVS